ncbi:MAG: hypothetical protein ABUT39_16935 [Acidobacteriota bacterium]
MKLKDLGERYSQFTTKASDVNRQVGLAGLALIWLFKAQNNKIPVDLFPPALLLVAALGLDLLQYLIAAGTHCGYYLMYERRKKKGEITEDSDLTMPYWTIGMVDIIFFAKIALTCVAYILLFSYVARTIV